MMRDRDIDPDDIASELDKGTVIELAAALHRGDAAVASERLSYLFANHSTVTEWIAQGRTSRAARRA